MDAAVGDGPYRSLTDDRFIASSDDEYRTISDVAMRAGATVDCGAPRSLELGSVTGTVLEG